MAAPFTTSLAGAGAAGYRRRREGCRSGIRLGGGGPNDRPFPDQLPNGGSSRSIASASHSLAAIVAALISSPEPPHHESLAVAPFLPLAHPCWVDRALDVGAQGRGGV